MHVTEEKQGNWCDIWCLLLHMILFQEIRFKRYGGD